MATILISLLVIFTTKMGNVNSSTAPLRSSRSDNEPDVEKQNLHHDKQDAETQFLLVISCSPNLNFQYSLIKKIQKLLDAYWNQDAQKFNSILTSSASLNAIKVDTVKDLEISYYQILLGVSRSEEILENEKNLEARH